MAKPNFAGLYTALATPFKDGKLDIESFSQLIQLQMDGDVDGLVVNGTTGESPSLSQNEVKTLFTEAKSQVQSKCPLIVGTGTNCTTRTIENTKWAGDLGADAALVVTPYYNKPTQEGLIRHFTAVAEQSPIPVILYNVPGRTITKIEVDTLKELAKVENICGVKEASGDIPQGQSLLNSCPADFLVTSGDDGTCLDLMLAGGDGVISVISNFIPRPMKSLVDRARNADESVRKEFAAYNELLHWLYIESNPIPVKMALYLMGVISSAEMRLPMTQMTTKNADKLREVMQTLELC